MTVKKQPSPEQLEALKAFKARYGWAWKAQLKNAWRYGTDENEPHGALLRQVRNNFGPVWLTSFKLEA